MTSSTTPGLDEWPAKQWPPLRTANGRSCWRRNDSVAATSAGDAHWTAARGRTSWNRALNAVGSGSGMTRPSMAACSRCQPGLSITTVGKYRAPLATTTTKRSAGLRSPRSRRRFQGLQCHVGQQMIDRDLIVERWNVIPPDCLIGSPSLCPLVG